MKSRKSAFAASLLSMFMAVSATASWAEGVKASAVLGGTPYALKNYGVNVVKGRAILVSDEHDDTSKVIVTLSGLKPGSAHIGHIHGGSCAALTPGAIFHNLKPIVADESGKGTSRTVISKGMQGLADCEWWVAFHEGAENASPQTPALAVGPVISNDQKRD